MVKEGHNSIRHVVPQDQLTDIGTKHFNKQRHGAHQQRQGRWILSGTGGPVKDAGAFAGTKLCCVRRPTRRKHERSRMERGVAVSCRNPLGLAGR